MKMFTLQEKEELIKSVPDSQRQSFELLILNQEAKLADEVKKQPVAFANIMKMFDEILTSGTVRSETQAVNYKERRSKFFLQPLEEDTDDHRLLLEALGFKKKSSKRIKLDVEPPLESGHKIFRVLERAEQRPEQRAEQRPEQSSEQRAEQRAEQRPEQRPEQRAEQRAEQPADENADENADEESVLLLHGTKSKSIDGILKEGFLPSATGSKGPGVYLINNINVAQNYGRTYYTDLETVKTIEHAFIVQAPKKLRVKSESGNFNYVRFVKSYQWKFNGEEFIEKEKTAGPSDCASYMNNEAFIQRMDINYNVKTKPLAASKDDKKDSSKSIIQRGNFTNKTKYIYNSHHSLLKPLYLIETDSTYSVNKLVSQILYESYPIMTIKGYYNICENKKIVDVIGCSEESSADNVRRTARAEVAEVQKKHLEMMRSRLRDEIMHKIMTFRMSRIQ